MKEKKGSKLLQYCATISGNLSSMASSAYIGWTSPILKKLGEHDPIAEDNPLGRVITSVEASWMASLSLAGAIVGCLFYSYLAKRWGRRKSLLSCALPFIIASVCVAIARDVFTLYVFRLMSGFAMGAPFMIMPMYTAEISETSIRGILGSIMLISINLGWLWAYCIGPYVSYTAFWMSFTLIPIVFFTTFYFMPESPVYLLAHGKHDEAVQALAKLRGKSPDSVKAKADEIRENIEAADKIDTSFMNLIRVKSNLKALLITCALFTFQNFSGTLVVLFYAEIIFTAAGTGGTISPAVSAIIVGAVQFLFCCITPMFVENWGRRILLIISSIGETISLFALGLYFFLVRNGDTDVSGIGWLPLVSLMTFVGTYNIGWSSIPWIYLSEMFNSEIKSKAFSCASLFLTVGAFLIVEFFGIIADAFGMYTGFWMFSFCCLISIAFVVLVLPETKGKSLAQIQAELAGKSIAIDPNGTHL